MLKSRDRLFIATLVVAILGVLLAAYLTYVHYNGLKGLACIGGHNGHSSCEQVQSSRYSFLFGIPVALLGLISYIVILVSLFVRDDYGRPVAFLFAVVGFGFSLYLTYREIFTLKEICEWCVTSAVLLTVLSVLTAIRLLQDPTEAQLDGS